MRRFIISTILLLLFVSPLFHHEELQAKNLPQLQRIELKNGLTIITDEVRSSPLVSINIFVRVGSKDEARDTEGITHFCEHLFFRGTRSATGTEFKSSLEALGGLSNAETTKDYTRYYLDIPAQHAMKGIRLMVDALQNASFDELEIEQERKVVLEEYKMNSDNFINEIYDDIYELAYQEHPYQKRIIGTEKNIKRFRSQDFLDFRKKFYTPEKLIFVIVGNCESEAAIRYITDAFKNIPRGENIEEAYPAEKKLTEVKEKTLNKFTEDSFLTMAFKGPSVKERQYIYATDVLCFMLGTGKGSLLNRELAIDKDIAKDVSVNFLTQKYPGLIIIFATVKPENVDVAEKSITSILKKISSGDMEDEEIARAKNLLISSYSVGNETNDGKASSFGFYEAIDSSEFARTYIQNIRNVKKAELVKTAQSYFNTPYYCVKVMPDPKMKKAEEEDE